MTVAGRDLEVEQRVDADREDDVVDHRDDRRRRHLPLEPDREVEREHEEEEDQRLERLAADLVTPRGADRR